MKPILRPVGIVGTGYYVPEHIVTNADLERELPTTDEWIRAHTGIEERRIAAPDEQTSDLAVNAAKMALDNAGLKAEDVDGIVMAIGSGDYFSPPTANVVQHKLGCPNAFCVDIRQACAASIISTVMAAKFVADDSAKTILMIAAELSSRTKVAPDDRTGRAIFADGAGAYVLQEVEEGYGILGDYLRADGSAHDAVGVYGGGSVSPFTPETIANNEHCIYMQGRRVWDFVVMAFPDCVHGVLDKTGHKLEQVDLFVPHQANLLGIHAGMDILKLPYDKAYTVLEKYGNAIEAGVPIALAHAVAHGRVKKGDLVLPAAFGAGLNWGSLLMRWAY